VWDRIADLREEIARLYPPDDGAPSLRLQPGEAAYGPVEAVGFNTHYMRAFIKIDGAWLEIGHKQLCEQIEELRPDVGDLISVECVRKVGNTYEYDVRVER
jgi:hypothetical protein